VKSIFRAVMLNPNFARHIGVKYPIQLRSEVIKGIENTKIYASNPLSTLHISLNFARNKEEAIFIGDCVKIVGQESYGIVTKIYLIEKVDQVFCDLQDVLLLTADEVAKFCKPSEKYLLGNELYEQDYVIIPSLKKQVPLSELKLQSYLPGNDTTPMARPTFLSSSESYSSSSSADLVSSSSSSSSGAGLSPIRIRFEITYGQLRRFLGLNYLTDLKITKEKLAKDLVIVFVELTKDELVMFKTRYYMVDMASLIIRDMPSVEKWNSIWTSFAFSEKVPPRQRFETLARFVREGELGFNVFNVVKEKEQYLMICFGMYSADQKEFSGALAAIQHVWNAIIQCYRCPSLKENLDNPFFPRAMNSMTAHQRMAIFL
jgi:hypothetical protein